MWKVEVEVKCWSDVNGREEVDADGHLIYQSLLVKGVPLQLFWYRRWLTACRSDKEFGRVLVRMFRWCHTRCIPTASHLVGGWERVVDDVNGPMCPWIHCTSGAR